MFLKNRRSITSASDESSDNTHKAVKKKKATKPGKKIEERKITHIIINYSITVYSNPLTMKFIIPTVKTFPSFSGHLAVMRRQIRTQTLKKQLRKVAAKEQ